MSVRIAPDDLRELAESLAHEAGELAAAGRRASGPGVMSHRTKSSATDPVTEYDTAAEECMVARLAVHRPADAIIGEEGASHPGSSGLEWHLDPIDGTVNFLYGLPAWCTSVGVLDSEGAVAGAIYAPLPGEMYSAARGRGATLNGVELRASDARDLGVSLMATGFSYDRATRDEQARRLVAVIAATRDVRRSGSAALDLCSVAAGRVDAYFEEHLNSWDLAAGALIAQEAGATISDLDGSPFRSGRILAAASGIHGAVVAMLAAAPPVST